MQSETAPVCAAVLLHCTSLDPFCFEKKRAGETGERAGKRHGSWVGGDGNVVGPGGSGDGGGGGARGGEVSRLPNEIWRLVTGRLVSMGGGLASQRGVSEIGRDGSADCPLRRVSTR